MTAPRGPDPAELAEVARLAGDRVDPDGLELAAARALEVYRLLALLDALEPQTDLAGQYETEALRERVGGSDLGRD